MPLLIQDGSTKEITGPGGLPLEQVDGSGNVLFYLQDQLGSTRGLADTAGTIVASYSFDVYGNQLSKTGSASTPFGYAGQYTDAESGLQYLRARYYDPATLQFMTVDPLLSQTADPYSYTAGDALNGMDPMGLTCGFPSVQDCVTAAGHVIEGAGGATTSFVSHHIGAVAIGVGVTAVGVGVGACIVLTEGICGLAALAGGGGAAAIVAEGGEQDAEAIAQDIEAATEGCLETTQSTQEYLYKTFDTPGGQVEVMATATYEGDTVTLEVATYAVGQPEIEAGAGPYLQALREFAKEMASKGYRYLRIVGIRTKNRHAVDQIIDLWKYRK